MNLDIFFSYIYIVYHGYICSLCVELAAQQFCGTRVLKCTCKFIFWIKASAKRINVKMRCVCIPKAFFKNSTNGNKVIYAFTVTVMLG